MGQTISYISSTKITNDYNIISTDESIKELKNESKDELKNESIEESKEEINIDSKKDNNIIIYNNIDINYNYFNDLTLTRFNKKIVLYTNYIKHDIRIPPTRYSNFNKREYIDKLLYTPITGISDWIPEYIIIEVLIIMEFYYAKLNTINLLKFKCLFLCIFNHIYTSPIKPPQLMSDVYYIFNNINIGNLTNYINKLELLIDGSCKVYTTRKDINLQQVYEINFLNNYTVALETNV